MAWNKPTAENRQPKAKKPSAMRGVIAGLVVVALGAGIVAWLFRSGEAESRPLHENTPTKIKTVEPAAAPKKAEPEPEKPAEVVGKPKEKYPGEKIVEVSTNSGYVIEVSVDANGRMTRHVLTTSPWEFSSDGLLAMVLASSGNGEMPPLPAIGPEMDEEFKRSLKKPIEILPTDSDEVVAMKKIVMSAREEMKELLKEGGHFSDILIDHHKLLNENGKIRSDAMRELYELKKSGDAEGAHKYEVMINAAFSQMGIEPIGDDPGTEENLNKRQRRRLRHENADRNAGGGPDNGIGAGGTH